MSKIKDWIMETEDVFWYAIECGAKEKRDIYSFIKKRIKIIDKGLIDDLYNDYMENLQ